MTYTEIVAQAAGELNWTDAASLARLGTFLNIRYKRIVSSLGIDTSKRTSSTQSASVGSTEITFTNITKVTRIADITDGNVRLLREVTWDELREEAPATGDTASRYAVKRVGADSVVVAFDTNFQTTDPSLRADGYEVTSTISGSTEPAFPEDFHDILVWGAKADGFFKMEKLKQYEYCEAQFRSRLSELKLFIAKSLYLDRRQGARESVESSVAGGSGGGSVLGETSYTQTGLITFDRDPSAPFAVTSGSAKVANLDADLLDGIDSLAFAKLATDETITGAWTFSAATEFAAVTFNLTTLFSGVATFTLAPVFNDGFTVAAGVATVRDVVFATTTGLIRQATADAADTGTNYFAGGGAALPSRGGVVSVWGNESAGAGRVNVEIGNVAGARLAVWRSDGTESMSVAGDTGQVSMPMGATLADAVLLRPELKDYSETTATGTISTNTLAVDYTNGSVFTVALNAAITTFTIANPSPTGKLCAVTFVFTADGTIRAITWPSGTVWPAGVAPTMTGTNAKRDIVTLLTYDAGTTWYGLLVGQNF